MQKTMLMNARSLQHVGCTSMQTDCWPAHHTLRTNCAKALFSARSLQSRRHSALGHRVSATGVEAAQCRFEQPQVFNFAVGKASTALPCSPGTLPCGLTHSSSHSMDAIKLAATILERTKTLETLANERLPEHVQLRVHQILDSEQQLLASLEELLQQPALVADTVTMTEGRRTETTQLSSIASHPIVLQPEVAQPQDQPKAWASIAATRGSKATMEDVCVVHTLHPELGVLPPTEYGSNNSSTLLAGVFDGHGGSSTSSYVASHLPLLLNQQLNSSTNQAAVPTAIQQQIVTDVFQKLDQAWRDHGHVEQSGSTAVVALLKDNKLTVANAGDSVAVLCRGGQAVRLTATHNLSNADEVARVTAAGGRVVQGSKGGFRLMQNPARVQRYVAPLSVVVTRGFGDYGFKGVGGDLVVPTPHVTEVELSHDDQIVLLTSDGVTDVMTDDEMVKVATNAVHKARQEGSEGSQLAAAAAKAVKDQAMSLGAWDNLTVVAVVLDWEGK